MITTEDYKKMLGASTGGRARKYASDMVMNNTWTRDLQRQIAYLYDFYHDIGDERLMLYDLHPEKDKNKVPIDIKFIQHSTQTYDKDQITFHIQLRPGQGVNVDYYDEMFANRYEAIFPVGLYIDIMDESEQYNRWLVVNTADHYGNQFPTYEVLPCDKILRWIDHGKKYEMAGCLRAQNSYNSGLWTDNVVTTIQDQQKFIVPLNRDSETLFYNHRMIIDALVETEPRTWLISKVNRLAPHGICRVTLAQDMFNEHHDYIERDEDGNVIAQWADYFTSNIAPTPIYPDTDLDQNTEEDSEYEYSEIKYSGLSPRLKVGGSPKTFTVIFYDENKNEIPVNNFDWEFLLNGEAFNYSDILEVTTSDQNDSLSDNQIKIKFTGDRSYYNSILTIKCGTSQLDVEIVGL